MSNQVYANNMEVSCKAAAGKSICAFPDVCLTPPQTPATPPGVPIPYPNTGMASDTTSGSTSVKISGKEVMLKNKSYFKKSMGDEAGCAPKKGVITSKNMGKVYFTKWSMDVKVEGENVVRMMDLTTHNHASSPGNAPPWPYIDEAAFAGTGPCKDTAKALQEDCPPPPKPHKRKEWVKKMCDDPDSKCRDAMKCVLSPYAPAAKEAGDPTGNCCPGKTPHHLVEVHCFAPRGNRTGVMSEFKNAQGKGYHLGKAPCICVEGPREDKEHGEFHAVQQGLEDAYNQRLMRPNKAMSSGTSNWSYGEAKKTALVAMSIVKPECNPECTAAQLDAYHNKPPPDGPGVNDDTPLRSDLDADDRSTGTLSAAAQRKLDTSSLLVLAKGF
jgi:hypothetical protein